MSARGGSRAEASPGGHIGPPLHGVEGIPNQRKIGAKTDLANGAGQSPPPTGATEQGGLRRGAPGVWLPPAKFRNGIWGVSHGHPALRKQRWWCAVKGRCRHRPLRGEGEVPSTTQASGAQRSVCGADGRNGRESQQRSSPKCPATPDNPSVTAFGRASSLYTREPLGTGDADCRVGPAGLLAMTTVFCHSEERSDVGIRPFYDGRWTGVRAAPRKTRDGTPGRRALRVVAESRRDCPGQRRTAERLRQRVRGRGGNRRKDHPKRGTAAATAQAALSEAESAERAAGQIRSLPDDLRVQHGAQRSEVSAKLRPCSRRDCDN